MSTLSEIIRKVSNELSVLNIRSNFFSNPQDALAYIQHLNTTRSVEPEVFPRESNGGLKDILEFIGTNQIDLYCTVEPNAKNGWLGRFFGYNVIDQLATQEKVPVLVIKQ